MCTKWICVFFCLALAAGAACRSGSTSPATTGGAADSTPWGGLQVAMVQAPDAPAAGGQVVVLLHGWGAPGDNLVPLAQALLQPGTRFVVPAAPLAHPAGGGGRAWWHLDLERRRRFASGAQMDEIPEGLPAVRAQVQRLLRDVRKRLGPKVLTLAGFSQGGMLAMDVALAANPPVDRVVVLSGTLIAEGVWRAAMARPGAKPQVFLAHGRDDAMLPFAVAEQLVPLLQGHGFQVDWVPFSGGHQIPDVLMGPLTTFLARP